jgi:Domain of unknown function (DUF4062)
VERRYQVFVSSTYTDLIEERRELIQALLEMECLPAGMELFPAANESQWDLIKRAIDDSDYYVVVVGGRYGSMGPDGVSYTEAEYDYAVSTGMPVLGFIYADPDSLPRNRSELDPDGYKRLTAFREKVKLLPVRTYTSPKDLGGKVSRSLMIAQARYPRDGWIRGQHSHRSMQQTEIAELRSQVLLLQKELEKYLPTGFEFNDDEYTLTGRIEYFEPDERILRYAPAFRSYAVAIGWEEIFMSFAPRLAYETSDEQIVRILKQLALEKNLEFEDVDRIMNWSINPQCLDDILVHLLAIKLIEPGVKERAPEDSKAYWRLSGLGRSTHLKFRVEQLTPSYNHSDSKKDS